ncbi:hypothetical protein BG74_04655 [Sodalis-like endosymbiont of Proechinophthirus fluctus]|nr:hypothetical protein BG74_04655 [Sodalis-like endosymbiont of Proechinophthirus fluctus]
MLLLLVTFKKSSDGKIDSNIAGFYLMLACLVDNECAIKSLRKYKIPREFYLYFYQFTLKK